MERIHKRPCFVKEACRYVSRLHRHNGAPQGGLWAISAYAGERHVGVVIVGRPISRMIQATHPDWCEVTRLCTDGTPNACSFLYGAAVRAARELGWKRIFTYTLASEPGTSLIAAGWKREKTVEGEESWSRKSRERVQVDLFGVETRPTEDKVRWYHPL